MQPSVAFPWTYQAWPEPEAVNTFIEFHKLCQQFNTDRLNKIVNYYDE